MKKIATWIAIMIMALSMNNGAMASEKLTAVIEGRNLKINWSGMEESACVLTVYQNAWPFIICNVESEGEKSVELKDITSEYSVRLKTDFTCLSVKANVVEASQTLPATIPETTFLPTATPKITVTPAITSNSTADNLGTNQSGMASEAMKIANQYRKAQGLSELRMDSELTQAACVRAKEIVEKFSHTRPDGSSWATVSTSALAENIAKGQKTAERVMASWMSSDGHRKNILNANYGSVGICAYIFNGITYWVQLFGK